MKIIKKKFFNQFPKNFHISWLEEKKKKKKSKSQKKFTCFTTLINIQKIPSSDNLPHSPETTKTRISSRMSLEHLDDETKVYPNCTMNKDF